MNIQKNSQKSPLPVSSKFDMNTKHVTDTIESPNPANQQPENLQLASYPTSMVNLLKTIIGSGILGLPQAIVKFGLVTGVSLMFAAAFFATFGLHILNVAAMQLGRKSSFAGLCSLTYPKAAFWFDFAIAIKCVGTTIAYFTVIGTTFITLLKAIIGDKTAPEGIIMTLMLNRPFVVIFSAVLIAPVCFMRKMDSLKYTSYAGMAAVLYLVILTVVNFFNTDSASFSNIPLFVKPSLAMFSSYGSFVFAYTCHQNILPIQNEARNNTPRGMMNIIATSMTTATIFYLAVAIFGAATYGTEVNDNILNDMKANVFTYAARIFYILLLLVSVPLQVFPCRLSIEKMALFYMRAERLTKATSDYLFYGSTIAILILTAGIACFDISLKIVLQIVGAVAGTFICYFLPSIIFNKLFEGTPWNWRRIASYVLLAAGVVSFVLSSIGIVAGIFR